MLDLLREKEIYISASGFAFLLAMLSTFLCKKKYILTANIISLLIIIPFIVMFLASYSKIRDNIREKKGIEEYINWITITGLITTIYTGIILSRFFKIKNINKKCMRLIDKNDIFYAFF